MSFSISSCSPVLLLAYVSVAVATSLSANESISGDARSARVTGRIVKVYSGSKPEPIVCVGEGYQIDPSDCAVFYRCVKSNKEKYTVFRFQCGPGTIYDPETEVCNHPKSTKRSECNGFIPPNTLHHEPDHEGENEIDFSVAQELPSPIKVNKPASVDHNTVKRDDASSTAIPWISSTFQTSSAIKLTTSTKMSFKPSIEKSDQQAGDTCTSDGFMGDSKNCHVFYRCVGSGRGDFTRYQFSCSDDTIWDDDVQSCNYPSFVKRSRCGRSSDTAKGNSDTRQQSSDNSGISTIQTQHNYGSKVSQVQTQINNGTAIHNHNQFNYGQRDNQSRWPENLGLYNKQNQKQMNYDSAVSQTQAEMIHGNKAVQIQVQVDNTKQASQQQQAYGLSDDENTSSNNNNQNESEETAVTVTSNGGNKCTSSGFMGDSDDCMKFYRCVDNGRGSFTRYEFSCGDGTVWDSSIEACNHAWAVKSCGQKTPTESFSSSISVPSEVTSTTAITETTTRPYTTTEQLTTNDEDEDTSYGNQNQATSTSSKPTTLSPSSQGTTEGPKAEGTKCTQSGFMGDSSDCKKFYRCVDNGSGSYTRYEFTCGEGTVWDPEIDGCNHAWAVSKCGGSSTNVHQIVETTTTTTTIRDNGDHFQVTSKPTSISTTQTTDNNVDDYDTGYGQAESSSGPTSTATTKQPQPQQPSKDSTCRSNGFMGDAHDCKKFYRCVDNGNGEYTRYEFSCGEGTVWDNSIDACNHAWAVKSCETGADQSSQTQSEVATQEITTSESGTSENNHTSPATLSSESTLTTQIPSKSPVSDKVCTSEGFKGDSTDCKKFYRCVDNGKGSYTKYEFTCGEGTVWDSEIQDCNHQTSTNKCGSSQTSPTTISEQTSQLPEMENDEMSTETTTKTTTDSSQMTIHTSTTEKPQSSSSKCDSEGFYGDSSDCKKFYRCVDNGKGGYTRYDFNCGEGTVWDQELQACNHPKDNQNCAQASSSTSQTTEVAQENATETNETTGTTSKTETSTQSSITTSSLTNQGKCTSEGFFANPSDCNKFYRCVSDGEGSYTKYDFACGEGTVWVQEIQACDHDNEVNSCSAQSGTDDQQMSNEVSSSTNQPQTSKQPDQQSTGTSTFTTTESQTQADQNLSQSSTSSTPTNSGQCNSEGFYANENDCTKFYRCVENGKGGYTKYDFACGEETAWDSNIQACNHVNDVNCNTNSSGNQDKPQTQQDETFGSTESTGTTGGTESTTTTSTSGPSTQSSESTGSSMSNNDDKCTEEGYFGNSKDCTKFYRCVDNGKSSYTKYDFDCGEGTIWDQDIIACNHPRDVNNPSCKEGENVPSSSSTTTTSSSPESSVQTTTQSLSQTTSSSTTESNGQDSSNCSQENTSKKPENKNVNCTKEGFYGDPDNCKKFYRCVDWDGNGQRFSVYHFECGEGTIWDPSLDTCNHEDSVYPSRDCSGTQSQSANVDNESSTTKTTTTKQYESTTTDQGTTAQSQTTGKEQSSTTEHQSTTQESTTQSTTSKQTTTQKSTTQDSTTTEQTSTTTQQSEKTTSQQSTTEKSTTEQATSEGTTSQQSTTEQTTTQQSTTEQTTAQQSTTSEQTTTQQLTTSEQSTTEQSNTSDQTTTEQSTTSEPSTTEQTSTTEQNISTQESTTQQTETEQSSESTTQSSTTQESTTQQDQVSTTEGQESTTTEGSTESSSQKECPDTESDQYLYVCPTGFRRHPKYCNLFYQCTEDNDTHEVKIATFNCPNNTIYDEKKAQCVEENKAEKKCNGEIAQKRRFKRLDADAPQPMVVSKQKHSCPSPGHYPFEKEDECSSAFLKCEQSKSGKLRGFVYRCPDDFVYWSVSRRCEPVSKLRNCKESVNNWSRRYEIPVERSNVAR